MPTTKRTHRTRQPETPSPSYDVVLSFAGEDRDYVEKVASALKRQGVSVFYDVYEQVELWGKDLYEHLDAIYGEQGRFCVMFISEHYARKLWTNHERRSAQERAFRENGEYILPVRFDETEIPGVRATVGYLSLRTLNPKDLASKIAQKLGPREVSDFLPPNCDRLYKILGAKTKKSQSIAHGRAAKFMTAVRRMSDDERHALLALLYYGCSMELPHNIHASLDLLKRITKFSVPKIRRLLAGMASLGIHCSFRQGSEHTDCSEGELVVIEWHVQDSSEDIGNATQVIVKMFDVVHSCYCEQCGTTRVWRQDFSSLSTECVFKGC